ncbi:mitochondrial Complex1_LYR_1 motif-containing protein 4-like protein [Andalucia godoyi]|uniref:Mitochondrial Complex1_LYR_1 motif-containing protein 4-like protein n=1 Tax=Andalucia godoyi TaxID=505711 RepID=A0A8K0AHL0_ANDGO|nr:mitochondrial Complex1_LYR_1 motif-containing protein 4-like protein [Andalucia godoyi]|eukprot:ANDGO_05390.mRNA.1 mitochondrial Complex1_LYR_1 motif-containing protein 4 homolog
MSPAVPSRSQVVALYRQVLRNGQQFADYNFREYVQRIARQDFRSNAALSDPVQIASAWEKGVQDAAIVKRQSIINSLYSHGRSVLEKGKPALH